MYRPRIIPVLLLKKNGLVKSEKFKQHKYIGDPINAVRIFNDLKADELVFLDIDASAQNRLISLDFVTEVGEEANMPFAVGGGIQSLNDIQKIIQAGAEKVIIQRKAMTDPAFIKAAAAEFGSSTIAVCIDYKNVLFKGQKVCYLNASKTISAGVIDFAQQMEDLGAGEVILQSVDRDGKMIGYDNELLLNASKKLTIPIVALGGAGKLSDLKTTHELTSMNGLAAGSLFVYNDANRGVLINYPEQHEFEAMGIGKKHFKF